MNTPTINTIMTYVVRIQESVSLFLPDDTYRVIRWVNEFAEPQIFYPAMDEHTPVECGIVGCITFLRNVSEGTTYRVEPKEKPAPYGWCATCTEPLEDDDATFCPKCEAEWQEQQKQKPKPRPRPTIKRNR